MRAALCLPFVGFLRAHELTFSIRDSKEDKESSDSLLNRRSVRLYDDHLELEHQPLRLTLFNRM